MGRNQSTPSYLAVDTETTGLEVWSGDQPYLVSTYDGNTAGFVRWSVCLKTAEVDYSTPISAHEITLGCISELLADETVTKLFFNAPFDIAMLESAGFRVAGRCDDASLLVRVLSLPRFLWKLKPLAKRLCGISDEDEVRLKSALKSLARRSSNLGYESGYWSCEHAIHIYEENLKTLKSWETAGPKRRDTLMREAMEEAEQHQMYDQEYALQDAVRTWDVWFKLLDATEPHMLRVYEEELLDITPITRSMVTHGMRIDQRAVRHCIGRCIREIRTIKGRINRLTGSSDFNPGSTKQKKEYFIEQCKIEPLRRSEKTGEPLMDADFMEHVASGDHGDASKAAQSLIEFNKLTKAKSTYFDYLLTAEDTDDILHTDLSQFGTVTGRYSGRLLTLPKRAPKGSIMLEVRKAFIPREGHVLLCADFSQIEARVFATIFNEKFLLEAFNNGEDPYEALKVEVVKDTSVDITRQIAKIIFLGRLYGLGANKLTSTIRTTMAQHEGANVSVTADEAASVIRAFDSTFPGVMGAMRDTIDLVEETGYITNAFGQDIQVPKEEPYKGVNYIVQSTAARVMKQAMIRCYRAQERGYLPGKLLLTIHDELIFEVKKNEVITTIEKAQPLMEHLDPELNFKVELPVEFEVGIDNLYERKTIETREL